MIGWESIIIRIVRGLASAANAFDFAAGQASLVVDRVILVVENCRREFL